MELTRGPWTAEEDRALVKYVNSLGEGQWNALAQSAGLNRTGKSCRLRWLNYLRPDVRRGNITLQEQLLILELHYRWGNRWSKIAKQLPGRTDNEIKNYWRTRVQKQAKQLKCDVNSKQFKDALRCVWIPRLVEKIQATGGATITNHQNSTESVQLFPGGKLQSYTSESSNGTTTSSDSSNVTDCLSNLTVDQGSEQDFHQTFNELCYGNLISPIGQFNQGLDFSSQWINGGDHVSDILWDADDMWFQFNN